MHLALTCCPLPPRFTGCRCYSPFTYQTIFTYMSGHVHMSGQFHMSGHIHMLGHICMSGHIHISGHSHIYVRPYSHLAIFTRQAISVHASYYVPLCTKLQWICMIDHPCQSTYLAPLPAFFCQTSKHDIDRNVPPARRSDHCILVLVQISGASQQYLLCSSWPWFNIFFHLHIIYMLISDSGVVLIS